MPHSYVHVSALHLIIQAYVHVYVHVHVPVARVKDANLIQLGHFTFESCCLPVCTCMCVCSCACVCVCVCVCVVRTCVCVCGQVRLLTEKGTGKPRGIAFVEMPDSESGEYNFQHFIEQIIITTYNKSLLRHTTNHYYDIPSTHKNNVLDQDDEACGSRCVFQVFLIH